MSKTFKLHQKCASFIIRLFWRTDVHFKKAMDAYKKYQSSNHLQDLQFSLKYFESAHRAADPKHPRLAAMLINYATALWARYETTGRPDGDLRQVIDFNEAVLKIWNMTDPPPNGYPIALSNLGNAYFEVYCRDRNVEIFQKAISAFKAVRENENFDALNRNTALARMGIALWTRCDLEKTNGQLDEGIHDLEEAFRLASASSTNADTLSSLCLAQLANAHDLRFHLFKQADDLTKAISYGTAAREQPQASLADRAATLYNLSRLLWERYQDGKAQKELHDAETIAKEAQGMVDMGELRVKIDGVLKAVQAMKQCI